MKNKWIVGLLALGSVSMLCGFDSAETAESILTQVQENTASVESMTSAFDLNCDIAINISDETTTSSIGISVGADYDIQATLDPLATALTGTMTISTFGNGETIDMQMYMISSDDTVDTYVYTEDSASDEEGAGTWEYSSVSAEDYDIQSLMELSESLDYSQMSEWGIDFTLASEAADYEGTECYLLTTVMDVSTVSTILEKAEELAAESGADVSDLTGDADLDAVLELLDGLQVKIEYYVDTATYLPVAMHIDLNDSDLTALNNYLAAYLADYLASEEDSSTIEIILNDLSMDYTMSYDNAEEITVPQEALDAIAAGEAEDLEETIEEAVADAI
ncbi:MAG: hypothetical protein LUD16_03465 [Lachnospiraceae bacterium]|nr:hypothetical protein [Lachnospiraceae bacterium]